MPDPYAPERMHILQIALSQLGVREATGRNDGKAVAAYLQATGIQEGNPWCAAYVSWVFKIAGYAQPRTAWSPALFPKARQSLAPLPANLFGIYYTTLRRVAHVGFVIKKEKNWIISVEGNTNMDGSREGNGVYQKKRHIRTIYAYSDWITKKGGDYEEVH
ncbi:MAG: peptidoglycan-binding protein [Flavobacteriales bacterium]|nr:MAG: peptidoglycan-binding protein [Flavobacteriales bacterium]